MGSARISSLLGKITVLVVICCCALPARAKYSGGTGEPNNPYRIATVADMNEIGTHPEDRSSHFVLIQDIDMNDYSGSEYNVIGSFSGVFDGNNHVITGLTIDSNGVGTIYLGLFGYVQNGEVLNLGIEHVNISGGIESDYLGGLVGRCWNSRIVNCYSTGLINDGNDSEYIGGLIGSSEYHSFVSGCYSTCSVSVGDNCTLIGGLVGSNSFGIISNCYSSALVTGGHNSHTAGGLVGRNALGDISNCYSTSSITDGNDSYELGGMVGYNNGGDILNSYSTGAVSSGDNSYNVGGVVGRNRSGKILNCFWDVGTSNLDSSDGGVGLTTTQMQNRNTFLNAGWDFVNDDKPSDEWGMTGSVGYPILWWELEELPELPSFSGGTGNAENPYIIANVNDLFNIGHNPRLMDKHFLLDNPIDMNGIEFYLIGNKYYPYTGRFDGNDHIITKFVVDANILGINNNIGVFGYVDKGEVLNLGVEDINIILRDVDIVLAFDMYNLGGVVGFNSGGSISNCYSTGSINGIAYGGENNYYIGGLAGYNDNGTILNCHSDISVSSGVYSGDNKYHLGGLVGYNADNSSISNCYSTGSVTGAPDCGLYADYIGGLVGINNGSVSGCYSTSLVNGNRLLGGLVGLNHGNITDCYSSGSVNGGYDSYEVGGLVGASNRGRIENCFSTGSVSCGGSSKRVGGLAGRNAASLSNCYSTGSVSTGGSCSEIGGLVGYSLLDTISYCYSVSRVDTPSSVDIGGFIGEDSSGHPASFIADFWNSDINPGLPGIGNSSDPNVIGESTTNMQTESTFTDAGWDFVYVWSICEQTNYPRFLWQIPIGDFLCPDGVNFFDFSFFAGNWAEDNCGASNDCDGTDLDQLGTVDINDLRIFVDNWLRGF